MTDINFRIRAYPVGKESDEFVRENFRTEGEADGYFKEIMSPDENNIINFTPYDAIVATFEEFYNGEWTVKCKRIVRK